MVGFQEISYTATDLRQAWVRVSRKRVVTAYIRHTVVDAATISVAIAAAAPISPASSRSSMASDASLVSGEYRKTTAEMVVMALTKRERPMSRIAGRHTGTV